MPTAERDPDAPAGGAGAARGPPARGAGALPGAARARQDRGPPLRGVAGRDGGRLPGARPRARGGLRAAGAAAATRTRSGTFPSSERPLEWAFCASQLGRQGEAARVFSEMGHPALAAMELEAAGAAAAARLEWERVLRDERLAGRPYETALAHFNLGEALLRIGDCAGGAALARGGGPDAGGGRRRLRDRRRDRARVRLLQRALAAGKGDGIVRDGRRGLPEHDPDHRRFGQHADRPVLRRLRRVRRREQGAGTRRRWRRARSPSTACGWDCPGIATTSSARPQLWIETARANQSANGPLDLSANAYQAAIDAATSLGDLALAGQIYAELAELPLTDVRRRRYRTLARRYEAEPNRRVPAPAFPAVLRRHESYMDIWRDDLVEWEFDGEPVAVLARRSPRSPIARSSRARAARPLDVRRCGLLAGESVRRRRGRRRRSAAVLAYEMLRPLERLFDHEAAEVRAAVMRGRRRCCPRAPSISCARRSATRRRPSSMRPLRCCERPISWRRCRR